MPWHHDIRVRVSAPAVVAGCVTVVIARRRDSAKDHCLQEVTPDASRLARRSLPGDRRALTITPVITSKPREVPIMTLVTLWLALLCCTLVVLLAYLATDSERC
jgi:hypothetical protein